MASPARSPAVFLLLAACGNPASAAFTCADAAAILGHPTASVAACDPAPHLPEIYQVALTGGGLKTSVVIGVHLAGTQVDRSTGNAAMAAFLDGLGPRRDGLTMMDMIAVLRAFDTFPVGIDGSSSMFDLPGIGKSSFTASPFVLDLYNGHPPEPGFIRARLTGPPWVWTSASLAEGATAWK